MKMKKMKIKQQSIKQLIEKYSELLKEMRAMHKHSRNFGFENLVKEFLDDLKETKENGK